MVLEDSVRLSYMSKGRLKVVNRPFGGWEWGFFVVEMDRNYAQTSFECILATFSLFCSNLKLPLSYHSTLWPLDGDILKLAQLAFLVTLLLFSDIY